jgi:DNA-binding CsgD family transcriptional regulator
VYKVIARIENLRHSIGHSNASKPRSSTFLRSRSSSSTLLLVSLNVREARPVRRTHVPARGRFQPSYGPVTDSVGLVCEPMRMRSRVSDEVSGLLFLGPANRVVYANEEAIGILAYPRSPKETRASDIFITGKIRSLILKGEDAARPPAVRRLQSGKRQYVCHFLSLRSDFRKHSGPSLVVLMERAHQASSLISSAARKYHLTSREKEAVESLLGGLTSKEIAQRMRISPNTVKNFLRLTMIKMGVSTRSGIAGRVLDILNLQAGEI